MENQNNPEQATATPIRTLSLADIVARAPDPVAAIDRIGFWLAKSGMFRVDRLEAGPVIALTCISEGLSPAEFGRTYHIVEGKQQKRAEAVLADFRRRGGAIRWTEDGSDGKRAAGVFTFEGRETPLAYSMEDATRAGLVKPGSGWTKRPANMLRARLVTNGVRMLCPEIFGGEYDEETATASEGPALTMPAPDPAKPAPAPQEAAPALQEAPAPAAKGRKPKPAPTPQEATATPPEAPAATDPAKPIWTLVSGGPDNITQTGDGKRLFPPSASGIADKPAIHPSAYPAGTKPADPLADPPPLSDEQQAALLAAIGGSENVAKAREWLVKKGWLTAGTPIECLPVAILEKIVAKVDRFREAAGLTVK